MARTDEYYDLMEQKRRQAREEDARRERSPEKVIADQQQEALALIRARPDYKEAFERSMKLSPERPQSFARRAFPGSDLYSEPDQRRSFDVDKSTGKRPAEPNVEDLYAKVIGDLIGARYSTGRGDPRLGGRGLESLAGHMGSMFTGETPDVWAKAANPKQVQQLAELEAYFESTKKFPERVEGMTPETRQDYEPPRLKMLEPQKK